VESSVAYILAERASEVRVVSGPEQKQSQWATVPVDVMLLICEHLGIISIG
jgi:hypothetical protein